MITNLQARLAPPTPASSQEALQTTLLNIVTLWAIVGIVVATLFYLLLPDILEQAPFLSAFVPVLGAALGSQYLLRTGRLRAAILLFVAGSGLVLALNVLLRAGPFSPAYSNLLIVVLLAGMLIDRWAAAITAGVSLFVGVLGYIFEQQSIISGQIGTNPITLFASLSLTILAAAALLFLYLYLLDEERRRFQRERDSLDDAQAILESRVAERTRDLALASEVGQALGRVRELDPLLVRAVDLIRSRFGLYYAQIYLLDERSRTLVLRAGTGVIGRRLADQRHHLPIGPGSINGMAAARQKPVVVEDTHAERMFRPNVLLPETRSEMSIPLVLGERMLGVLDLQSERIGGLTADNLPAFTVLASQLAVALDNAYLFTELGAARGELEQQTRRLTRAGWDAFLDGVTLPETVSYTHAPSDESGFVPEESEAQQWARRKAPIAVAGEAVGLIEVLTNNPEEWTEQDRELLDTVAQRVAEQVESLRLLHETERYRRTAEEAVQRLTHEGWTSYIDENQGLADGIQYADGKLEPSARTGVLEAQGATFELTTQGGTIGAIELTNADIAPDAARTAALVAQRLGAHIETLRLAEQREQALGEAKQRTAELGLINEIVGRLSTSLELEDNLAFVAQALVDNLSVDQCGIALLTDTGTELRIVAEFTTDEESPPSVGQLIPIENNASTQQVLETRETLIVTDAFTNPLTEPIHALLRQRRVYTLIIVPIVVRGRVIGTVGLDIMREGVTLDERQLRLVETIVYQAGSLIDNARLFVQTQEQLADLTMLQQVATRLSGTLRIEDVVDAILPLMAQISGADFASVFKIEGEEAERIGTYPAGAANMPVRVGERIRLEAYPLTQQVIETRESLAVFADDPQLTPQSRETFATAGVTASATIPIINQEGEVWGIFSTSSRQPERVFTERELSLLRTVAEQSSLAFDRAELFQQTQEALAETETLYAGSARVAQAASLPDVLHALVESTALGKFDETALLLFAEPVREGLPDFARVAATWTAAGGDSFYRQNTRLESTELPLLSQLARSRQYLLANPQPDAPSEEGEPDEAPEGAQLARLAMFPLVAGGLWIGTLVGQAPAPLPLADEEIRQIATLTDQASNVVQNLRLYEESRLRAEELAGLNEMARQLISELSVSQILSTVHQYAGRLMQSDELYVALYDEATDEVTIHLFGAGDERIESALRRRAGHGVTEHVIRTREPLLIAEDAAAVAAELGFEVIGRLPNSWLGVPMLVGEQTLGVIAVQDFVETHRFDAHDADLLTAVARQSAIALQNASLFDQTQEALAEAQALYEVSTELNAAASLEDTLVAAIRPALPMGASQALLWTYAGDAGDMLELAASWHSSPTDVSANGTWAQHALLEMVGQLTSLHSSPLFVKDVGSTANLGEDVRKELVAQKVLSVALLPLRTRARAVGLLLIGWPERLEFSERDVRLFKSIAAQTVEVVEGRLLLRATQQRTLQLETLSRIEADLSQAVDEADILRAVLANLDDVPRGWLHYMQLDRENRPTSARPVAEWRKNRAELLVEEEVPLNRLPLAQLWLNQPHDILVLEDVAHDERLSAAERQRLTRAQMRTMAFMPFYSSGRWQGFIVLAWPAATTFSNHHRFVLRRLLEPVSAVIASRRAQLAQQAALQETATLYQAIATLNAGQSYDEVLAVFRQFTAVGRQAHTLQFVQFDRPWSHDEAPEWLTVQARWSAESRPLVRSRYHLVESSTLEPLLSETPIVMPDVTKDSNLDPGLRQLLVETDEPRAAVFVPLRYGGRWIGLVTILFNTTVDFDEADIRQVMGLARQAAIAIQSLRLLQETRQRAHREQTLRQVTEKVRSSTDVETIMQVAVRELGQALGRRTFAYLAPENGTAAGSAQELAHDQE